MVPEKNAKIGRLKRLANTFTEWDPTKLGEARLYISTLRDENARLYEEKKIFETQTFSVS